MPSTKIKGQNLRVVLDGQVISAALRCDLKAKVNVADASTKDDTGDFLPQKIVSIEWEVMSDSAVWTGDGTGASTADLLEYRGATVWVELALTGGAHHDQVEDVMLSGKAIISDIRVNAKNRQRGTVTITMKGKGPMAVPKRLLDVNSLWLSDSLGRGLLVAG